MSDLFEGTWSSSNGIIRENVDFSISSTVRFYLNTNSTCFPPHWHLPGEIIAPLQNGYEVTVGGDVLELSPRDILVISPSELHSINAPPSGVRYIINYDPDPLEQITDMVALFSQLRPYYLLREQDNPELSDQLQWLLRQIETEYNDDAPYREGAILTSLINFLSAWAGTLSPGTTAPHSLNSRDTPNSLLSFAIISICTAWKTLNLRL